MLADIDMLARQYALDLYINGDYAGASALINAATREVYNTDLITINDIAKKLSISDPEELRNILLGLMGKVADDPLINLVMNKLQGIGIDLSDKFNRVAIEALRGVYGDKVTDGILDIGIEKVSIVQERIGKNVTAQEVQLAFEDYQAGLLNQSIRVEAARIYRGVLKDIDDGILKSLEDVRAKFVELSK